MILVFFFNFLLILKKANITTILTFSVCYNTFFDLLDSCSLTFAEGCERFLLYHKSVFAVLLKIVFVCTVVSIADQHSVQWILAVDQFYDFFHGIVDKITANPALCPVDNAIAKID